MDIRDLVNNKPYFYLDNGKDLTDTWEDYKKKKEKAKNS